MVFMTVCTHTVHTHDTVACPHLIFVTGSIINVDKCIYIHFFNKKHNIAVVYYSTSVCSIRVCKLAEILFAFFMITPLVIVHLYNRS